MRKFALFISLSLAATLLFAAGTTKAAFYDDRFLICLQPDLSLSEIDVSGTTPVTGIASLDQLLALREVRIMEQYVPGATMDDMDGDVILANIYRLSFDKGRTDLAQVLADFSTDPSVLYAEGEPINRVDFNPNDTRYGQQWFLQKIEADEAWDLWDIAGGVEPGSAQIVLASIDSGVQYTHPDLWASAWVNQAEVPTEIFADVDTDSDGIVTPTEIMAYISDYDGSGTVNLQDALHSTSPFMNGVDDDNWDNNPSSYIDDLLGYDVSGVQSTNDPDNDPMGAFSGASPLDVRMHGTHVGGLLAATTDNSTGIASAIFNGSLMSVKCLYDQDSNGYISGGYSGMLYAAKAGADIVNNSWGGTGYSTSNQSIINVIYNTYDCLVVAAAGNGDDFGNPTDTPHYPSGFDNVVSVTAVSSGDGFSWANYGDGAGNNQFFGVDLSAPGENIHSTVFTTAGSYSSWPGTSMASPIAASCFGLLKSANPDESNDWLIESMMSTADNIDEINPNYAGLLGAGRVNIYSALAHSVFPLLSFDSYSLQMVNDNGDGQLSPGEEARMRVNIFNEPGWVDATEITAILRSSSEYVTITDSTAEYGDIFNGNVGVNIIDRYQFSIAADAPSGAFPFSLEVTANSSTHPYVITMDFEVEASIWQAFFPIASGLIKSGNAVVDIDGDGSMEIIFGAGDSLVHAFKADGTEVEGFPVLTGNKIEGTPAVGDVDADGDLEIVIGSKDDQVHLIQHDGSRESIYTSTGYIFAPPTLYDLDGDGDLEIIVPAYDDELIVVHHDGSNYDGFPLALEDHLTKGAAVGDVNADGNINIVVGSWGDLLHVYNLDGTEAAGFPVNMGDKLKGAPVLADLDGSADGQLEIVFGCDDNSLHAISSTGTSLWSYATLGQNLQTDPAICDMDGDGDLEIAFGGLDRGIYVLDHAGNLLDGFPVMTEGAIYSSPAVADIDGDGQAEIFIGSNDNMLYGLHLDGSAVSGFPSINSNKVQGSPTIANLDGDSDLEIIFGTDDNIAALDLPSNGEVESYWPTHRGNLHRTGALPVLVGVKEFGVNPASFALRENYPNPFNPSTQIRFDIVQTSPVTLEVLDIRGRLLTTLVDATLAPNQYSVAWDGTVNGRIASGGVYLVRLSSGTAVEVRKMTLLK
jgi:serine protease